MIENRNTRHPKIAGSTFRKANSFFAMVKTKPYLERYYLDFLKTLAQDSYETYSLTTIQCCEINHLTHVGARRMKKLLFSDGFAYPWPVGRAR
jgi:hypothetical protein